MPQAQAPDTLPADFFSKQQPQSGTETPDTLPANFFSVPQDATLRAPTFTEKYIKPYVPSWESIKSKLPSGRTLAGTAGAAVGGAVTLPTYLTGPEAVAGTALAGGLGYTGGTHLYDVMTGSKPESTISEDMMSGALQEAGGPLLSKGIASRAEKGIPKAVERAIAPSGAKEKFALKGISKELAEDFPVVATHQGMYEKAQGILNGFSKKLETEWSKLPATVRIPTAEAKIALQKERGRLFNQKGQLIPGMEKRANELTKLIDYLDQNPTLAPADIRNHRQLWDELVNWWRLPAQGKSSEPESEFALRVAGNGLRNTINRTYPKIKALNAKVSPWVDAVKMLEREQTSEVGKTGTNYFYRLIPEAGGAAGGALLGRYLGLPAEEGAALGAGIVGLRQIMKTPAWQTASIPVRRQVARLMSAGMTQRAVGLMLGQIPQADRSSFLRSISPGEEK